MAIRKIALLGNPVLRKQAEPVAEEQIQSPDIQQLIADMIETMAEYDGRGLAAPQVHVRLQISVIYWDFDGKDTEKIVTLINPVIKPLTDEVSSYWEGCLSIPGLRGVVRRPDRISVVALDAQGSRFEFVAEGFSATVIQHECDHLAGKLYVDQMTDFSQFAFDREYQRFFAGSDNKLC